MRLFIVVFILLAGPVCLADQIYRSVDADGRVTYSDKPPVDAVESTVLDMPATEENVLSASEVEGDVKQWEIERDRAASQRENKRAELNIEIERAEQRLEDANLELENGSEPGEGDFIGNAGTGARPSPDYLARVERLEAAQEEAGDLLEELYDERDRLQ
ncbi:MAG: DUF4124 domain-containing protein [Pseudomonadales bacterium]